MYWLLMFVLIPIFPTFFVLNSSISKLSDTGLFPHGTTTATEIKEASFLNRVTDVWLGGAVVPSGARVCVTNNNQVYVNGVQAALPYRNDPEVGSMEIEVHYSDYSSQRLVYVPINESACGKFLIKPDTTFASSSLIYRHPAEIPLMLSKNESGGFGGVAEWGVDPGESTYLMSPLWSDIVIIILKVFGAWWILVFAFVQSWRIANRKSEDILSK